MAACQPTCSCGCTEILWELFCQRWRPASRPVLADVPESCGSWPASDGGLTVDLFLRMYRNPVGAGLPAMAACQPTCSCGCTGIPWELACQPTCSCGCTGILWELFCQRWRPDSRPVLAEVPESCGSCYASDGGLTAGLFLWMYRNPVGAGLPAMAVCQSISRSMTHRIRGGMSGGIQKEHVHSIFSAPTPALSNEFPAH